MTSDGFWWLGATWIWWKSEGPKRLACQFRASHHPTGDCSAHQRTWFRHFGVFNSPRKRVLITCYFDIFRRVSFLELYLQILHDLTALMFVALHPGDRAALLSIRGAPFAWTHYRTLFHNRFDHASIDIHATWAESTSMCVQIIPANWHTHIYIYTHILWHFLPLPETENLSPQSSRLKW